jgi:hypothetical protein
MLARDVDDLAALPLGDPAPDVVGGQGQTDGAHTSREQPERPRHRLIFAENGSV